MTDLLLAYTTAPTAVRTERAAGIWAASAASTDTRATTPEKSFVSWPKFRSSHMKVQEPTAKVVTGVCHMEATPDLIPQPCLQ